MSAKPLHNGIYGRHKQRHIFTWLQQVLLVALFALLPGCRDYSISTVIHPDGSCDRTIIYKSGSGSKQMPPGGYRLPTDTSWLVTWQEPEKKGGDYVYQATRHFSSLGELSAACAQGADSNHFSVTVIAESQFRWFYTYFSYKETYGVFNPFTLVPASQYLTDDEIRRFSDGDTASQLKKKVDEWQMQCMFEELFQSLVEAGQKSGDPALARSVFDSHKEELLESMKREDSAQVKGDRAKGRVPARDYKEGELADRTAGGILKALSQSLGTRNVYKLRPTVETVLNSLMRKTELLNEVDGNFTNTVTLPGIVLATNASDLKASTLTWHYSANQLRISEYQLHAESRVVNLWAIVLTGVVALGLLLMVVLATLRSRHMG